MRHVVIKRTLFFAASLLVLAGCSKKYRYDFADGYTKPGVNDSIQLDTDTSKFHVDRSKYGDARLFPGLVGVIEPRLQNYEVDLDLDYKTPDKSLLRISVVPQPWLSTGLYAPAGELIEIDVPEGVHGLTAQIGVWTDNLTGKEELIRDPLLVNKVALFPGKNYIRNLYGGPLIIVASRSLGMNVKLNVSGAVKSPDFVLGETTNAEWQSIISKTTVPWFELRGKRLVFDLPVSKLHSYPIADPTLLVKTWDSVIAEDYNNWYGLSDNPTDPRDQAPELPWRVVQDIQPSVGYAHNGFPVVAKMDDHWFVQIVSVSYIRVANEWGILHELGHNFQMGSTWRWSDLGEVSNNLHSFKLANRYGFKNDKMASNDFTTALAWAVTDDASKKFSDLNLTERLVPFVQILEKYGYDFQTYLTTKARHDQHTAIGEQNKIDFYYESVSEFVEMDMINWMHHWGLYPSQQAQNKISVNYPSLDREVWKFNPWTNQGGDKKIFISRSEWVVLDYDSQHSGYPVTNVFDGNNNSFWNTEYSGRKDPYPHYFTVDMTIKQKVDGFYFLDRAGNPYHQNPKAVDIYVGNDPNSLTKVVSGGSLPDITSEMKVSLPSGTAAFRYFKLVFTEPTNASQPVMDLAEVGIY